jgi:hypothetical protein
MPGNIVKDNDLNELLGGGYGINSGWDLIRRNVKGTELFNTKNITAADAGVVDLFQLNQAIAVDALFGFVTDATDLTDMTSIYFDAWDGAVSLSLTKTTTADLSGLGVGTNFIKNEVAANELDVLDAATVAISEPASNKVGKTILITPKNGGTTKIRYRYSSANPALDVTIRFGMIYTGALTLDGVSIL